MLTLPPCFWLSKQLEALQQEHISLFPFVTSRGFVHLPHLPHLISFCFQEKETLSYWSRPNPPSALWIPSLLSPQETEPLSSLSLYYQSLAQCGLFLLTCTCARFSPTLKNSAYPPSTLTIGQYLVFLHCLKFSKVLWACPGWNTWP